MQSSAVLLLGKEVRDKDFMLEGRIHYKEVDWKTSSFALTFATFACRWSLSTSKACTCSFSVAGSLLFWQMLSRCRWVALKWSLSTSYCACSKLTSSSRRSSGGISTSTKKRAKYGRFFSIPTCQLEQTDNSGRHNHVGFRRCGFWIKCEFLSLGLQKISSQRLPHYKAHCKSLHMYTNE